MANLKVAQNERARMEMGLIKPNEVRVNDYFLYNRKPIKITSENIEWACYGTEETLEGIPLTKEWLSDIEAFHSEDGRGSMAIENGEVVICYGTYAEDSVALKNIKFLHQLQNLYFSLTGEEFGITLNNL